MHTYIHTYIHCFKPFILTQYAQKHRNLSKFFIRKFSPLQSFLFEKAKWKSYQMKFCDRGFLLWQRTISIFKIRNWWHICYKQRKIRHEMDWSVDWQAELFLTRYLKDEALHNVNFCYPEFLIRFITFI